MSKNICVFCSSSDALSEVYYEAAENLGQEIAQLGWTLVYGAGDVGIMGKVARSTKKHGGKVVGVIPKKIQHFSYLEADELIITETMRQRKEPLENRSDVFVALPGALELTKRSWKL